MIYLISVVKNGTMYADRFEFCSRDYGEQFLGRLEKVPGKPIWLERGNLRNVECYVDARNAAEAKKLAKPFFPHAVDKIEAAILALPEIPRRHQDIGDLLGYTSTPITRRLHSLTERGLLKCWEEDYQDPAGSWRICKRYAKC